MLKTSIFHQSTGTAFGPTGLTNSKEVTVLDDRTYTINPSITDIVDQCPFAYEVSLQRKFLYFDSSTYGKKDNLFIWIISQSDSVLAPNAYNNLSYDLVFQDL